jgi:hypothetical protein
MQPDEFKELLFRLSPEEIVQQLILSPGGEVSAENLAHIQNKLAAVFNVEAAEVELYLVGSARLGFSLIEKKKKDLRRYRPFGPESDLDIAVVCPRIFYKIWVEVSRYAHATEHFLSKSQLGPYLTYGWLRPDYFPAQQRLCDAWWNTFAEFSADIRFGRRKVRGGLYYGRSFLEMYQRRAILDCKSAEELRL